MGQKTQGDILLELGLLLMVTGLFVGVLVLSVVIVLSREAAITSSLSLMLASSGAVFALLALLLVLLRRLVRFIVHG